jgi:hypothetical protein
MKAPQSAPVRLTAAGLAVLCVFAGCSKSDGEASPVSSAPASEAPTTEAATPADYRTLLITTDDIDSSEPFTAEPPIVNPNGETGVSGRFFAEDSSMIGSSIRVMADPAEAARVLELTRNGISNVTGRQEPLPIGTNGSVIAGMSLDQITGITVLTFSEQNAVVTLEFDGPYGKLVGLPTELIDSVARRQLEILKARLPEIAPPNPLPVAATIGGEPADVRGPVVCKYWNGRSTITAGNSVLKIVVELEPDASVVHRVELANVDDVYLSSPENTATATKAGNTYTVRGTASGESDTSPPEQITKPFDIRLTCP